MTNTHKVHTSGSRARVDPTPSAAVLEVAPPEVHEALAALAEANEEARSASAAVASARKARRLAERPSEISEREDALHEAERVERRAGTAARRAATRLASALDGCVEDLARKVARLKVERHVRACDAFAAFRDAVGGGGWTPARQAHALMPYVEPTTQARASVAEFGAYLDQTNVPALLERAGMTAEEAGLVWVWQTRKPGHRFLTSPARAALLGNGWTVDGEEVKK